MLKKQQPLPDSADVKLIHPHLLQCTGAGRMSLTMGKADGVTVITLTSDSESSCPPLCQILMRLCYSPVLCSVSQHLRRVQRFSLSVLGVSYNLICFRCLYELNFKALYLFMRCDDVSCCSVHLLHASPGRCSFTVHLYLFILCVFLCRLCILWMGCSMSALEWFSQGGYFGWQISFGSDLL